MDLQKTTVLSQDDAAEARAELERRLNQTPQNAHLVVLGDTEDDEAVVEKADVSAGAASELRWVIWARSLEAIRANVEKLAGPEAMRTLILDGKAQLFALSCDGELRDVLPRSQKVTNMRLQKAFMKAEVVK